MSKDRLPLHSVSAQRDDGLNEDLKKQLRRESAETARRQVHTDNYRRLVDRVNNASDREMERALAAH